MNFLLKNIKLGIYKLFCVKLKKKKLASDKYNLDLLFLTNMASKIENGWI